MYVLKLWRWRLVTICCAVIAAGCSSQEERLRDALQSDLSRLETSYEELGEHIDRGRVKNARMISLYADRVAESKPELRELTNVLRAEGTRDATIYTALGPRIRAVRSDIEIALGQTELTTAAAEVQALTNATHLEEYNRVLTDPLNVLADLSDGELPRVDSLSESAALKANNAESHGQGHQLVGNPHYGQWRNNSSGNSFWVWYGQYALLSNLMGGRSIYYDNWSSRRNYSYYHDWGRGNYTSPSARRQQSLVQSTAQQKFASQGKTFNSPYAKQRTGASSRIVSTKSRAASSSRLGTSRTSRSGSVRGYGSSSRGPSRGK